VRLLSGRWNKLETMDLDKLPEFLLGSQKEKRKWEADLTSGM
jgi:hypothetical protein